MEVAEVEFHRHPVPGHLSPFRIDLMSYLGTYDPFPILKEEGSDARSEFRLMMLHLIPEWPGMEEEWMTM